MFRNAIFISSFKNLSNYNKMIQLEKFENSRCYSKLYCQNSRYFAPSSVVPNQLLCKLESLHPWRYQHQNQDFKEVKFKCPENDNQASKPENVMASGSLTMKEKLKKAVTEYGSTVIVFHISISLISLGTFYLLVSAGLDVPAILNSIGLQNFVANSEVATSAGTFALAYAIHKVFAPVRMAITLGSVPFIVRYLRRIGFLKKA